MFFPKSSNILISSKTVEVLSCWNRVEYMTQISLCFVVCNVKINVKVYLDINKQNQVGLVEQFLTFQFIFYGMYYLLKFRHIIQGYKTKYM